MNYTQDDQNTTVQKKIYVETGKEIKERRKALGITQEELAEQIGKSPIHLRYLEKGERKSLLHVYVEIARVLKCTLNDLVMGCFGQETLEESRIHELLMKASEQELRLYYEVIRLIQAFLQDFDK